MIFDSVLMLNIPTGVSGIGGGPGSGNIHGSQVMCTAVRKKRPNHRIRVYIHVDGLMHNMFIRWV